MGVRKSMKIFMEGMQGFMTAGGNGARILHTPMGPFKWNDDLQVWVNVNNGFQMPNISMQDLLAMGYDPLGPSSGDGTETLGPPQPAICTATISGIPNTTRSLTPTTTITFPGSITTPSLSCSPNIYVSDEVGIATHQIQIQYSIDGGSNYTTITTVPNANISRTDIPFAQGSSLGSTVIFRASKKTAVFFTTPGSYLFYIRNSYDGSQIGQVTINTSNPV